MLIDRRSSENFLGLAQFLIEAIKAPRSVILTEDQLFIHTGGNHNNAMIADAVFNNPEIQEKHWATTHRGGHYVYIVPPLK